MPLPQELPGVEAGHLATGEKQPVVPQAAQHLLARAERGEAGEDLLDGALDLLVGILDHLSIL